MHKVIQGARTAQQLLKENEEEVCLGCGERFAVCPACTNAAGAHRPVYHGRPICSGSTPAPAPKPEEG